MQEPLAPEYPVCAKTPGERSGLLMLLSGLFGFFLFALVFPGATDNVESAQVVAGLVTYPPGNPMGIYHLSALSLLIDSAALLLRLGLPEWAVCAFFTGLQGALIFSGLTGLTLAFSRSASVSFLVPLLLVHLYLNSKAFAFTPPYLQAFNGHAYPILLVNHPYIYGTAGLFAVLLIWGLLAHRKLRLAGFLAGLMVWVHPSMGLACWAGAGAGLYFLREEYGGDELRGLARWFLAGIALSAAGMGLHYLFFTPEIKGVDWELASRIVENYERNWDTHRVFDSRLVLPMLEVDFYATVLLLALRFFIWEKLPQGARFLFYGLLAITATGAAGLVIQGYFPEAMPLSVRTFMLHRWLNINSMAFPALVFGILGYFGLREKNPFALGMLLANVILVSTLTADSLTWFSHFGFPEGPGPAWEGLLFPLLGGGSVLFLAVTASGKWRIAIPAAPGWLAPLGAGIVAAVALYVLAFGILPYFSKERMTGKEWSNPFFEDLSRGEGLLLLSHPDGLRFPLRTRRGVLLDPEQIDMFTYAKGAAPVMEEIFNRVYGKTLLRPRGEGEPVLIYDYLAPENWDRYTMADWQAIRREYQVTEVIVPFGYQLQLPLSTGLKPYFYAYRIPAP
ncbi:hypothetical protein EPN96_11620 [bacterium]|nr:MAG: hypothetical protein EPN96_11620 [bacterium]